jgi:L-aspartate oxidase
MSISAAGALLPDWEATVDVVIVGTGVAGLTAALDLGDLRVLVVTKGAPAEANTSWAQGGVAVVRDEHDAGDSVAVHVRDTLVAGAGLCDPAAVSLILRAGPGAIARLIARGARFDAGAGGLLRTREGGHTANRVIHAGGDATGAEIERALLHAAGLPTVLADHLALDVVLDGSSRARGLSVLAPDGRIGLIRATAVVLATGGAGHLYAATTNPGVATADGLAMALRAGAALADLEFMQFHPTVLWTGAGDLGHRALVTEAVRGEGAVLIDAAGERVMRGVHPLEDLAPRDVVSLAITRRLAAAPGGVTDHAFLDATSIPAPVFRRRFPTVSGACLAAGIDPTRQPIPVAPAAHYHCGGVWTDLDGRTTVPGLLAIGEVARTGLHGANRLASNSLLEGLVMGERAALAVRADVSAETSRPAELILTTPPTADPAGRIELQATMSSSAGIGRDLPGLLAAQSAVASLGDGPGGVRRDRTGVEMANLALVAGALLAAAEVRTESRGCHVRTDHPDRSAQWERPVVVRSRDAELQVLEPEVVQ